MDIIVFLIYMINSLNLGFQLSPVGLYEEPMGIAVKQYLIESRKEALNYEIPQQERMKCDSLVKKYIPIGSSSDIVMEGLRKHFLTDCEVEALGWNEPMSRESALTLCEDQYKLLTNRDDYQVRIWMTADTWPWYRNYLRITVADTRISEIICRRIY